MGRGGRGTKTTRKRSGLAQRPPGHIQQYGAQTLHARAHAWYDRDAHWLSLGYSEADAATKRRVVNWCWVVFVALTAVMVAASRTFEARGDAPHFSSFRCLSSLGLAAAVCYALVTDAYRNPPSLEGSPSHACGRWLGPYAYFTKHALTIQCVHHCLSFAGEATLDPQLLVMTHAFACFAAVVGIALTVLFLKLNWFEPKWRKEVLEATNQRGVNFTEITLVSHLPPLPVAILDCFLAKRPGVFPLDMRNVMNVALFASCYCGFYVVLTLMNYKLVGRYPYPFMRALKRPWHWLAFLVGLLVLANLVILPLTFALLAANPT